MKKFCRHVWADLCCCIFLRVSSPVCRGYNLCTATTAVVFIVIISILVPATATMPFAAGGTAAGSFALTAPTALLAAVAKRIVVNQRGCQRILAQFLGVFCSPVSHFAGGLGGSFFSCSGSGSEPCWRDALISPGFHGKPYQEFPWSLHHRYGLPISLLAPRRVWFLSPGW